MDYQDGGIGAYNHMSNRVSPNRKLSFAMYGSTDENEAVGIGDMMMQLDRYFKD